MSQLPLAGPRKMNCVCGCGLFGSPRRKIWVGETVGHVKLCRCRRCEGSRHKKNAGARERRIAKNTGMERSPLSGGVSGFDLSGVCWVEETSNQALTRGLFRWFDSQQIQRKLERLFSLSSVKPKAFLASRAGRPELVVMRFEDWNVLQGLAAMGEQRVS